MEAGGAQGSGGDLQGASPPQEVYQNVGVVLSRTQLLLRRGSTLVLMMLVLAAGVLLSHFLTELLK